MDKNMIAAELVRVAESLTAGGWPIKMVEKAAGFDAAFDDFLKHASMVLTNYMTEQFPTLEMPVLKAQEGGRYVKIVKDERSSRSAWAFVDKTNGDVLKAAGWNAPAKNARANVFDKASWRNIGAYGPAYMRNMMSSELVKIAREMVAGDVTVATNQSYWQWEYDSRIVNATVVVDDRENLRLLITETREKSGIGKGEWTTTLEDVSLGTLTRPKLGMVMSLLKKHGNERTRGGSSFSRTWTGPNREKASLIELIVMKAKEWGVPQGPVPQAQTADPRERKELLMKFVQSMTPEEVEKAFAAVLGKK